MMDLEGHNVEQDIIWCFILIKVNGSTKEALDLGCTGLDVDIHQ